MRPENRNSWNDEVVQYLNSESTQSEYFQYQSTFSNKTFFSHLLDLCQSVSPSAGTLTVDEMASQVQSSDYESSRLRSHWAERGFEPPGGGKRRQISTRRRSSVQPSVLFLSLSFFTFLSSFSSTEIWKRGPGRLMSLPIEATRFLCARDSCFMFVPTAEWSLSWFHFDRQDELEKESMMLMGRSEGIFPLWWQLEMSPCS